MSDSKDKPVTGITDLGRQAARAVAQWTLGDSKWADVLLGLAACDDPKDEARTYFVEYPDDFDGVWEMNNE